MYNVLTGAQPSNYCTGNRYRGCERTADGNNYINPIQSARMRSSLALSVKYGRIHIRAKMPTGDWIWPGEYIEDIIYKQNNINYFLTTHPSTVALVSIFHCFVADIALAISATNNKNMTISEK